jgi:hypothetical protein
LTRVPVTRQRGGVDIYRDDLVARPLYGECHDRGDADW